MNYERIYFSLIEKRKQQKLKYVVGCQYERHHILPKSIRPDLVDAIDNIVVLTYREHFVAHHLLMNWFKQKYGQNHQYYKKMFHAYFIMASTDGSKYISARQYEILKCEHKLLSNGKNNPRYGSRMLLNIETQKTQLCSKDKIDAYLKNGWVIKSKTKIFNNGKIEVLAVSCPEGFTTGRLKNYTDIQIKQMHENRSNSQKGKRFMYNPLTNITVIAKENEIDKYLQAGYKFGRKLKRKTTKGYIWIYNETTNKRLRINPNQFDEYKKLGYTFLPKEYWWNNGKDEVKSINQPGSNYIRGRLPGLNTKKVFW